MEGRQTQINLLGSVGKISQISRVIEICEFVIGRTAVPPRVGRVKLEEQFPACEDDKRVDWLSHVI